MVKVAVITERESDFTRALASVPRVQITMFSPEYAEDADLSAFDCFCVLGGVSEQPLVLSTSLWKKLEKYMRAGKRFFMEFCRNAAEGDYGRHARSTMDNRLIYLGIPLGRTDTYDLLDDQCNEMIIFNHATDDSFPILVSDQFPRSHYRAPNSPEYWNVNEKWALWEFCKNIRICCIRIANFEKMRFAPICKWREVISHMISWITEIFAPEITFNDIYHVNPAPRMKELDVHLEDTLKKGLSWMENSGVLIDNGRGGVYEGFNYIISVDGIQSRDKLIRCDACGEVSTMYLMEYLRTKNPDMLQRFKNLQKHLYREFLIKSGPCKGMMRKSTLFYSVSSQDHTCRAIISTLLHAYHMKSDLYLEEACSALDFLMSITASDHLIGKSVDSVTFTKETAEKLRKLPSNRQHPSFNGSYMSALLLAYKVTGREDYRHAAELGMSTLMGLYPRIPRVSSETSELCRMLLPTIYLYWVTHDPAHLEFFKQLTRDLAKFIHASGAYLEWDTGYLAGYKIKGSLLAQNGDPVVDLSSSLNWIPMAYSEAYRITGDVQFFKLWQNIARFFVSCQLHSDNPTIDGCWTRGYDPDLKEVYGLFSDIGWRPWSIKSGWVVGEIMAGLENGMIFRPEQ